MVNLAMIKTSREGLMPLMCFGFCLTEHPIQEFYEKDGPSFASAEFKTWAQAKSDGWATTTDIRFSPDGKPVMLCPNCVEKLSKEKEKTNET